MGFFERDNGEFIVGIRYGLGLKSATLDVWTLSFLETSLYGLYPPHDVDMMLSEEACKAYCVNDTTCVAMTSKNDGSGLCTLKRTTFICIVLIIKEN